MPLLILKSARSRARMLRDWVGELRRNGAPRQTGDPANGTVFLIDGVGGFLLTPTLARVAFREAGLPYATYLFDWHRGVRGEMLADLTCQRLNRRAALRLARVVRRRRREHPHAPIHVLSYSGGTGIAVFAAEKLGRRTRFDVMVLAASALSPQYPLAEALRHAGRCYALTSRRDLGFLGVATTIFGTIDRRFGPAAGARGFQAVAPACDRSAGVADTFGQYIELCWTPDMCALGHAGHHTGAASVAFIREYIVPLLA
jgi:hypothetical protein